MSAIPRFWPTSRAAARRRVSRRGFFAVAGVHLAAVAGVFLLSAGPATKVTVAAGRKDAPASGAEAEPLTPTERAAVVWMDPATFEAPPPAAPPASAEPAATSEPPPVPATTPPPRPPPPVREPFLTPPPPPPVTPRRKPPATAGAPTRKSTPPPRPATAATRPVLVRPRTVSAPRPAGDPVNLPPGNGGKPGGGGAPNAAADDDSPAGAGGTDWYASMLHERFYARWEQPTSVFASAQRYTATLRLRIERDGRISDCRLVRSSGLVPMDESVLAAAARVARVDPPPSGLLRGGAYVVNVGFVRE